MYVKLPQVEKQFGVAAEFVPASVKICGLSLEGQISFRWNKVMLQERQRDTTDMPCETNKNNS